MTASDAPPLVVGLTGSRTAYETVAPGGLPADLDPLLALVGDRVVSVVTSRIARGGSGEDDSVVFRVEAAVTGDSPRRVLNASVIDGGAHLTLSSLTSRAVVTRARGGFEELLVLADTALESRSTFDTSLVLSNAEALERDALLLSPSARALAALRGVVRDGVPAEWAVRHHGLGE